MIRFHCRRVGLFGRRHIRDPIPNTLLWRVHELHLAASSSPNRHSHRLLELRGALFRSVRLRVTTTARLVESAYGGRLKTVIFHLKSVHLDTSARFTASLRLGGLFGIRIILRVVCAGTVGEGLRYVGSLGLSTDKNCVGYGLG